MLGKIKSKLIMNKVFSNLRIKKKLNILRYNNKLQKRLNITSKDYELYVILKEFNDKYKIKINDIDNTELNIRGKYIRDEGSIDLFDLGFKNLIKLDMKL